MKFQPSKKAVVLSSALLGGALLSGCGNNSGGNSVSVAPGTPGVESGGFQVALLTPGDINDAGWNQLAHEGLQAVEKELGARTAHQVTKQAAEHEPALQDFGAKKFNLVFCHGFEYGERVKKMGPDFADTKFVVVGGNVQAEPNVATLVPKLEEATYLLGMAAGGMTKTNVLGCIGGMKLPTINSTFQAFEAGAKAVNPKVQVKITYVGDFENQNKAKELAKTLIAQKADFLLHNADQAGKGMFDAAEEAKGVMVFGSNRDQNSVSPETCLGSAVIEMPHAFVQVAKSVKDNSFKAEFIELNVANDNIGVHWNDKLKAKIPAALLKKINDAQAQIKAGKLVIKRNVD